MHMFLLLIITLLSTFLNTQVRARDADFCFVKDDEPYLYMGTKTAYHFVHGDKTRFQSVPNCQPVQIWMLATHGTRYPTTDEINQIVALTDLKEQILHNHETRGEGYMCNQDLDNLRGWKPDDLMLKNAEVLTQSGIEDMKLLARRLQSNFPELFPLNVKDITSNYKFLVAGARDSMIFFKEGLFGYTTHRYAEENSLNDTLLTTYKTCSAWKNNQKEKFSENSERNKFDAGTDFQNLLKNVSRRLGFRYNISIESIDAMYNACRYEKSWTVIKVSSWCTVFSKEELRILEYREDLDYYYKAGYGREINARLGCPLLQNMMQHFWNMARDEISLDEPKGIFYFTDIVSFQNFLTTMGINEDQMRLTAFNYRDMAKRQWRTSLISSFAANLIAVFYKCNDTKDRNKIMFYLAEKPVYLQNCKVGLCDWEYLKSIFGQSTSNCKLDVCWKNEASSNLFSLGSILVPFICFLVYLDYQQ